MSEVLKVRFPTMFPQGKHQFKALPIYTGLTLALSTLCRNKECDLVSSGMQKLQYISSFPRQMTVIENAEFGQKVLSNENEGVATS